MVNTSTLLRFVVVGGSTGALTLLLTWLYVGVLGLQVTLGSTLALTFAGIYNYCLHYYWTFSSETPHGWVLLRYLLMCLGALFVNGVVVHFGVMALPIHYLLVQILATAAVVVWSFCLSSLWVFR